MKYSKHFIYLYFLSLILLFSSCKTYNVIHITENNIDNISAKNGYFYFLPLTAIKVDVTIKHTYFNKGPYANFAEKFLGLTDFIKEDSQSYSIIDSRISSVARIDPNQIYFIKPHFSLNKKNMFSLAYCDNGALQGLNILPPKRKWKMILPKSEFFNSQSDILSSPHFSDNLNEKLDTIIEKVKYDTMTYVRKVYKKVFAEKSSEEKAKETAAFLIKIKESKFNIISGFSEIPYTMESLKFMKQELDTLEQKYLSLFTGATNDEILNHSFFFIPQKNDSINDFPLFRFSPAKGVNNPEAKDNETIYIKVLPENNLSIPDKFQSSINKNYSPKKGIYYRIPDFAYINISKGKTKLAEEYLMINQFGMVSNLPLNIKKVLFNPKLGSLKLVKE